MEALGRLASLEPHVARPGSRGRPPPANFRSVDSSIRSERREDGIAELTSKQRAHLRALAHDRKALLQVGTSGVTEAVLQSVEEAFSNRELLKVKVLDGAPEDVDRAADAIRDGLDDVHVVQTIGKTMVLYRPFPDEPEISLPG